jgi:hypothetical protein
MPRPSKHPRLRSHSRKNKAGKITAYYFYDMRPEGKPDVPLGRDYDEAIKQWEELHLRKPRITGTLEEAFEAWEADVLPTYGNAGTRRNYAAHLKRLRPVFGASTWDAIEFTHLKGYLKARNAKTQGNREMALLSIVWNWARGEGLTKLPYPAAGMERARWKNKEQARQFEVTDAIFQAIHACGDTVLQATMDLATATGLRLTDCRHLLLPPGESLRVTSSKTGKAAEFDLTASPILTRIVQQRRTVKADHLMLLTTPNGKPVSATMLRDRYDTARAKAAERPENAAIADQIRAMYLRDCRKRASDLAGSVEEASNLLQHSSVALTQKHYRTRATKLKPVR